MTTAEELNKKKKSELLELCKNRGISCSKSWTKEVLILALRNNVKPTKKKTSHKSNKSNKSKKSKKSKKVKKVLECGIKESICNSKTYKDTEIIELAKKCGVDHNGTREEICKRISLAVKKEKDLTKNELQKKLEENDVRISSNLTKPQMIKYLLASREKRCDPEKKILCDGELVCDINNIPGVCIPEDLSEERKQSSIDLYGKKIVGSKKAIKALKKRLEANNNYEEDLTNLTSKDLSQLLSKEGITKYKPTKKEHLLKYLLASREKRCDPEKKILCDGELVCDINNKPGVCIPEDLAEQRKLDHIIFDEKKNIWFEEVIRKSKKSIRKNRKTIS